MYPIISKIITPKEINKPVKAIPAFGDLLFLSVFHVFQQYNGAAIAKTTLTKGTQTKPTAAKLANNAL